MKHHINYNVVRRPTNTTAGQTNIVDELIKDDGSIDEVVDLGYIEKVRGSEFTTAYMKIDEDNYKFVGDDFRTRSQAAHKIYREYYATHGNKAS